MDVDPEVTDPEAISMDDVLELEPSPRPSLRGCLLGARPAAGGLGAGALKILACSWFAVGLGTLSLLPNAAGAHKPVRITAQSPQTEAVVKTTAQRPPRVSASERPQAPHRTLRAVPADDDAAGIATFDAPGSPRTADTTGDGDVGEASASSTSPAVPAAEPPVAPPAVEPPPEPVPPLNVPDVAEVLPLPLPVPPTPSPPPPLPELPLPDVGAVTSGLPLP